MSLRMLDPDMKPHIKLEFNIPDNIVRDKKNREDYSVLNDRLIKISQSGGKLSTEGEERKEKIKQAMLDGDNIELFIEETKDVRHAVSLYLERENKELTKQVRYIISILKR